VKRLEISSESELIKDNELLLLLRFFYRLLFHSVRVHPLILRESIKALF